ncbi:MAG: UDP-glucose 4-epimerase GalE [Bacilli bacterium]|nr:UDP-glucose 4-epimerase GalE [Bacilli bacterium]
MQILVTGGLGFIGSHTALLLKEAGHDVVIVDNLSNSKLDVLQRIKKISNVDYKFYKADVTDEAKMKEIFARNKFDGIIHFAGLKAVSESISKPLEYYYNNVVSTLCLIKCALEYNVERFVFSSSATVYGENDSPLKEDMKLGLTTNPYGETKVINEKILRDVSVAYPHMAISLLRYFNPIGAHPSGLLGEAPNGLPNNLMPFITQVASNKIKSLKVFGNDYETVDGTGVRDYIHVMDLAKGHIKALENIKIGVNVYNLGTGKGTSVLELINAFEKINNIKIPYEIVERRKGDVAACFADATKAYKELGWKAELTIEDMVRDAWNFEKDYK